ncbi:methionyl-tRNA formyltransferase [Solirubrobacter sp. CPCC 204708]|uniref:Methionyl-tRNA formyltransferase n=1 Tax=Solirubrobacter deserti TaxID=2282478 RepID=A0ABT4RR73_9ACTN|nr:methionyl-tRNA formyltransferase [Solirubrobacter deserti]MBE2314752.1 methionyl-tRNA formyltransferase [Solirubrobacter deserti]MDA0141069.1 methionyl-tRNA formyltransferase [Solirubrobacter deserti]
MRNVYLGTSEFAAVVLRALAASDHRPQLVVTRPDAKQGRGQKLAPPPVAVLAAELGIPFIQPADLHAPETLQAIAEVQPEVLTTCAYGVLIKEPLLSDYEMINVHPSLLPRWRGAAPIERSIMAGDAETGVAIMRVTAGWDSGPVYALGREPIREDDDYGTLVPRLEELGARLLVQVLDERPQPVEQDESGVTYANKIGARERALDPTQTPEEVERTIRALRPHIGSRLPLPDGTFLGVTAARVDGPTRAPAGGLVRTDGLRLLLDCHGGALEILEVRPPGGKVMPAADWLRGQRDAMLTNFRFDPALPDRGLDEILETAQREWRDPDDEWQPHVCALAARGDAETLAALEPLARSDKPELRELAAYVVGQLGTTTPALPAEQEAALRSMAEREQDPTVLAAIICAFGHMGAPAGHDWLLAQRGHADVSVREAVAFALGGRPGEDTLAALIELSADEDAKVRDWATFALGTLAPSDGDELRDALAARLDDPDEDTRMEAVHGLALRGDARAAEPARELLAGRDASDDGVWRRHLLAETRESLDS